MSEAVAQQPPRVGPRVARPPAPVVPAGAEFSGLLHVRGPARIDGRIEGEIIAADILWIGETGRVRARVEARSVVVAGALEGEVRASDKIELLATARVSAALHTPRLALAEGCFFEGRCLTGEGAELPAGGAPPRPV